MRPKFLALNCALPAERRGEGRRALAEETGVNRMMPQDVDVLRGCGHIGARMGLW